MNKSGLGKWYYDNPLKYQPQLKFSSKSGDLTKSHECEAGSIVHNLIKIYAISVISCLGRGALAQQ
jgi:hypothetical protein